MTRSITKYIYFHSKIDKESIGDTQNLVELFFQAIFECFSTLHGLHFARHISVERFASFVSCLCTGRYCNGKYNKVYIF